MEYTIKRLKESDAEFAEKLQKVFARAFGDKDIISSGEPQDAYLQTLLARPDVYMFAALDGDEVIGGVTGYELPLLSQKKELYLYDLAVDEKYRKQGIATALINELKVEAKKAGVSVIFVEAESQDGGAIGFYQSLGATQVKVEHFNIEDF